MKKQRDSRDDRIFYAVNAALLTLVMLVVLYPLIFIVSCSFSSAHAITSGRVILWPVDVTLRGYKAVFDYPTVLRGYLNTFFYTFSGTLMAGDGRLAALLRGRGVKVYTEDEIEIALLNKLGE